MKVRYEVLSDVAMVLIHANIEDMSSLHMADEQTFEEIEFAVAIKRALHTGAKRITIDIIGGKGK
jgi:hypothetical protein